MNVELYDVIMCPLMFTARSVAKQTGANLTFSPYSPQMLHSPPSRPGSATRALTSRLSWLPGEARPPRNLPSPP